MNTKIWKRLSGKNIDNIHETIISDLNKYINLNYDIKFIVGCDSQVKADKINYITTIVFIRKGKGGSVYFYKEVESSKNIHIQRRLWNETEKAVNTAKWLDDIIIEKGFVVDEIHADINSNSKYKSNSVVNMCTGYIKSMGYKPIIKPNSFVASKVADKRSRK